MWEPDTGPPFEASCNGERPPIRRWDEEYGATDMTEFLSTLTGVTIAGNPLGFFDEILPAPPGSRQHPQPRYSPWRSKSDGTRGLLSKDRHDRTSDRP